MCYTPQHCKELYGTYRLNDNDKLTIALISAQGKQAKNWKIPASPWVRENQILRSCSNFFKMLAKALVSFTQSAEGAWAYSVFYLYYMPFKDLTLYIPDPGPLLEFFPPSLQFTVLVSYCRSNNKHRRSDFTQIYCITILEVSGLKCVSLGLNSGISRLFFLKAIGESLFAFCRF